jgi:N-glycosylase/DNA lyase
MTSFPSPDCYGRHQPETLLCTSCPVASNCDADTVKDSAREDEINGLARTKSEVSGQLAVAEFDLSLTLYSGQTFRWGRDRDGWWKGIAYGVAFHLKQEEGNLHYVATSDQVSTYIGQMAIPDFLRWYLRTDEPPKVRVPRADRYLRKARDQMRGFRFVRQDPWECTISYILSVQAHMALTKRRIQFLAEILGSKVQLRDEQYWAFPSVLGLAQLNEGYYRHQRFGWRSKFVPTSVYRIRDVIVEEFNGDETGLHLDAWRDAIDSLRALPNTGVGLKVAKCIDLFSLDRLSAVPVDTWVRKFASDWYGIDGSDARICTWAEDRGGKLAGYWNEYLFAYYRELNAPTLDDRVISFAASDAPSGVLPFVRDEEATDA